ncbi:ABC transporter substrate-binding protein, partial [Salmonella enterica]|uniref:ABC transporter substrate-binding protein n=1 Tax=Salmonella enterica TaxID=28901 RepID=UPI00398C6E45
VLTVHLIFARSNTWHTISGSGLPCFAGVQFADNVKSVRKLDNTTVEFRLTKPDASFLWHLATHYAYVMSAEYAAQLSRKDRQELLDRQPVVTGPFQLPASRAWPFLRPQRPCGLGLGNPPRPQGVGGWCAGG